MRYAAHGFVGFRASPRLYRGKVLLFVLAIGLVSLAEALRPDPEEKAATPAEAGGIERVVVDATAAILAPEAAVLVAPEVVCGEVAGPFAVPLVPSCATCGCTAGCGCSTLSLPFAPRAS